MEDDSLEYQFESITVEGDTIVGEFPSLQEPIEIPDRDWTEIEGFEGNWEPVTEAVIEANLKDSTWTDLEGDPGELQNSLNELWTDLEGELRITLNELAAAVETAGIVADTEVENKHLQSRLLSEYLVQEGVYRVDGESVKILETDLECGNIHQYLNWAVWFNLVSESLFDVVDEAENVKKYTRQDRDMDQEHEVDPVKQLCVYIEELEIYHERFWDLEKKMRQISVSENFYNHEVPKNTQKILKKDLQNTLNIVSDPGERTIGDAEEVGNIISEVAAEIGTQEETVPGAEPEDVQAEQSGSSGENVVTEDASEIKEPETADNSDSSSESGDG